MSPSSICNHNYPAERLETHTGTSTALFGAVRRSGSGVRAAIRMPLSNETLSSPIAPVPDTPLSTAPPCPFTAHYYAPLGLPSTFVRREPQCRRRSLGPWCSRWRSSSSVRLTSGSSYRWCPAQTSSNCREPLTQDCMDRMRALGDELSASGNVAGRASWYGWAAGGGDKIAMFSSAASTTSAPSTTPSRKPVPTSPAAMKGGGPRWWS